ncbi:group II intron maturase-specific domain-containing protein [Nonomuraea sp. NPDC004297]
MNDTRSAGKPFDIPKVLIWNAYQKVKANKGAAGVDGQSLSFKEIAAMINPVVAGWINYYGRFYKSELIHFLEQQINPFLVKWVRRKYKRYRRSSHKVRRKLAEVASVYPGMFAHWRHGALPTGSTTGAV